MANLEKVVGVVLDQEFPDLSLGTSKRVTRRQTVSRGSARVWKGCYRNAMENELADRFEKAIKRPL